MSIFINSQDYYELPKKSFWSNGNKHHIFEPNNFRDVQCLYQDKTSMEMTLDEFGLITSSCWHEKYQSRTNYLKNDNYTKRCSIG